MEKRLSQIGNVRALAIFIVVLGHSIILYSTAWDLYETAVSVPWLDGLKRIINIVQMPLFFSLSGYLFAYSHRKSRGLMYLLKSKARRLLVPYLGIGLCYMLPIRVAVGFPSYQNLNIMIVLQKFLTAGDVGHLWFLPTLFLMFLISELVLSGAERIPEIDRFADVVLCFAALALYLEGYRIAFGYPPLQNTFFHLLWFSLGYLLNSRQVLLRRVYGIPGVKVILLILSAGLLLYCFRAETVRLLISLTTVALFVVNVYAVMPDKTCAVADRIDWNSFGIYLFHSPLIYITFATIPNGHPAVVVFMNLVVFGAMAFGLTELIRRTKLKVLIGE